MIGRRLPSGPPRIGIEHEFQVFDRHGSLDARALMPRLTFDGKRLDPGDRHAVRCRWGGVVTADGRELELATPPVAAQASGIARCMDLTRAGREALDRALRSASGGEWTLRGYSTHVNVEVADDAVVTAAELVAHRLAPAVMLLIDRKDSPGLLVRPRHGRLEFGGEYIAGERLRPALTMSVGVALVAARAARDRRFRATLPPPLDLRLQRSPQRFGWYVDRRAGGVDLYDHGRDARLAVVGGGSTTAGEVLARTWELARAATVELLSADAIASVDWVVARDTPLPVAWHPSLDDEPRPSAAEWPTHLVEPWERGDIRVATTAATWHRVVMKATRGRETRWLTIAGDRVDAFVARLLDGQLDAWLHRQFAGRRGSHGAA